jgi:hypothetical protein
MATHNKDMRLTSENRWFAWFRKYVVIMARINPPITHAVINRKNRKWTLEFKNMPVLVYIFV